MRLLVFAEHACDGVEGEVVRQTLALLDVGSLCAAAAVSSAAHAAANGHAARVVRPENKMPGETPLQSLLRLRHAFSGAGATSAIQRGRPVAERTLSATVRAVLHPRATTFLVLRRGAGVLVAVQGRVTAWVAKYSTEGCVLFSRRVRVRLREDFPGPPTITLAESADSTRIFCGHLRAPPTAFFAADGTGAPMVACDATTALAVGPCSRVFVAQRKRKEILVLAADGTNILRRVALQLHLSAHSLVVSTDGKLVLMDAGARRVAVVDVASPQARLLLSERLPLWWDERSTQMVACAAGGVTTQTLQQ